MKGASTLGFILLSRAYIYFIENVICNDNQIIG